MKLGVRGKVFVISLGLMVIVGLAGGLYLGRELTRLEESKLEQELLGHARTARAALTTLPTSAGSTEIDALADKLGKASGARITVISQDGVVIGDSSLDQQGLLHEENHRYRPEVASALAAHENVVRRFSTTVDKDLMYAAVPWPAAHGVVRAAMPLDTVRDILQRQRVLLLLAAALGLFVAVLLSAFASHLVGNVVGGLVTHTRSLLIGGNKRMPISSEDELGHLAGSLNKLADERSESISALIKERDRLNAVLQGVSEGLIALDAQSRIEIMNPAAMTVLGLDESPEGRKLLEAVRIPDLIELAERGRTEAASAEMSIGDPTRHVLARTSPLRATGGVVIVVHDVTDLRNMESMRRDLVANVSHELRTPVSILRANAETLLDGALDDPAQARNFVQAMLRHSERLSNLLSDLLDLSRIEGGAYPLSLDNVILRNAVQRAVDTLQRAAKAKNVTVRNDVPSELDGYADSQALDQVLVNLLDNAIKYSFDGGSIVVDAAGGKSDQIRLVVADDGPGIPERHRGRVFERFYRVDAGRSRAIGGTGLGLSIVKHLVTLMHGSVGVDPVEPRGAAFWVTLPRGQKPKGAADRSAA